MKKIFLMMMMAFFESTVFAQEYPRLIGIPAKQTPTVGQSLYIFTVKMRSERSVVLTIDDVEIGHFFNGESAEIAVSDGKHVVKAFQKKWDSKINRWRDDDDDRLTDTLNGEILPVEVSSGPKLKGGRTLKLHGLAQSGQQGTTQQRRQTPISSSGIEGAVARASVLFVGELKKDSTIAVISISSNNSELAIFAIDELEFQLVTAKQFTIVDRKTLDTVRSEQNFQLSGDVSDQSAVSIGNMLGANIVITGNITGTGNTQRLTLKALDVKTAQIVSMARESF
jgi:TolB-like protein